MFLGHSTQLQAGSIHLCPWPLSLSLHQLLFSAKLTSASSSCLQISPRLPCPPLYTFLTVKLLDCEWADTIHHVSVSNIELEFHLFSLAPQTFITAVIDGFRIRVYTSEFTPRWIETIRQDIVDTILNGLYTRLDHLRTKIIFDSVPLKDDPQNQNTKEGSCDRDPYSEKSEKHLHIDDHEAVISLSTSEWHIKKPWVERIYSFGSLDAQLRRTWDPEADRGSFVLIAENCSYLLSPNPPPAPQASVQTSIPLQIKRHGEIYFQWILHFIALLFSPILMAIKAIFDPASAVSLHVPRLDVTFDRFRLRDAELVRQGAEYFIRQYKILSQEDDVNVNAFIWDMLIETILGHGNGDVK